VILTLHHGTAALIAIDDDATGGEAAALHPDERARARSLTPARRRDWVAGRLALRAALAAAGHRCDAPVLADDRGAPILPPGVRGSISHKRGTAVGLVAVGGDDRIGVDLELRAPPRVDLAPRILTDDERRDLARLDDAARGVAVTLRFALKEAVYKAIDPFVRRYVGFREVAVWPDDTGAARVVSALPLDIDAAWTVVGELVVCSASARPR
jgi:enterobactin synthetase component D